MKPSILRLQKTLISIFYRISRLLGISVPPYASASAIITDNRGNVLVVNLSYQDGFALPGGLLQANETFEQGLSREIKEETNLDIKIKEFLGHYPSNNQFPTINALYRAEVKPGKLVSSVEGKVSWQPYEKVIKHMAYADNRQSLIDFFSSKPKNISSGQTAR